MRVSLVLYAVALLNVAYAGKYHSHAKHGQQPRNLIYLVSDGYGIGAQTMTRETKEALGLGPMNADEFLLGVARTKSVANLVTESASSATSLACGLKTYRGAIGLDEHRAPCKTLMEAAVEDGYKTGVIATSRLSDATPAAFTSHAEDRSLLEYIALQQAYSGVDLMLGGGRDKNSHREDGRDLFEEVRTVLGYTTVENTAQFRSASSLPLFGLFTQSHMSQEIDRVEVEEPSLQEMVEKSMHMLASAAEAEDTGFFLFIEGSNIDKRFHEMDTIGATFDAIEFDSVIKIVTDFAKTRNDTTVLWTSDHETRGVTLGNSARIGDMSQQWYPHMFAEVSSSCLFMAQRYAGGLGESPHRILETSVNFDEPFTHEELTRLIRALEGASEFDASIAFSELLNSRLKIGYGATDHSGEDVGVFGYGPGIDRVKPVSDNTELPLLLADLFGWDIGVDAYMTDEFQDFKRKHEESMGVVTNATMCRTDDEEIHEHTTDDNANPNRVTIS